VKDQDFKDSWNRGFGVNFCSKDPVSDFRSLAFYKLFETGF
jgi:hypothetical protein